jgi:hypothetical protein
MPASPQQGSDGVVATQVLVNGEQLPDSAQIISITVRQMTSRPGRLELKADTVTGSKCKPGSAIAVKVGYGDGAKQFVFQGTVQSLADTVQANNELFSIIVAEDALAKLRDAMVDKVFLQVKRSDIISRIIADAGLSADVPDSAVMQTQVVITGRSALDVCMEFAADEGLLLHAEDTKIVFTHADGQPASVLSITYGTDVIHFAGIGPRQVPGQVTYKSWSIGDGALLQAQAAVPKGTLKGVVRQSGNQDVAYLDALAAGAVRELGLMAFAGEGSFQGSTLVKVGVRIHMDGNAGPGDPMNFTAGDYTVTGCMHVIEDGNYVTTIYVGLDQPLPRPGPVPAPFLPATVNKTCQDPDGLGRFQVTLATIDPEQGVWAFPVSPYNGFYFPHDIGDQVLVSFLMNDPSVLAIAGTLPSKAMAFRYTRVAPTTDTPGVGQLAFGQSKLELAPGTGSGAAIASLSTQALKVELRDGGGSDQKISLQGAQAATAEVADGHVRLKTGASLIDVAQNQISSSSPLIQATAQATMTLNASAGITLDAAVISLNKDALKVI